MSIEAKLGVLAVIAYFIGAIPFGLIVGRMKGIDPRTSGSGNIGATNLGRLLGGRYFALVFTLDLLKGLLPMIAAAWVVRHLDPTQKPYVLWMAVGLSAIVGHLFPVYIKFKGGKGVATSAGVILGLFPYYTIPGAGAIGVFLIVFAITRTVSIGSILGSAVFPALFILAGSYFHWPVFGELLPLLIFAILMATLIIFKHRKNIARILAGTEHSFRKSQRSGKTPSSADKPLSS